MRGQFLLLAIAAALVFATAATAATTSSGKTADGCSYKIINGQYLTTCPNQPKEKPNSDAGTAVVAPAAPVAQDTVRVNSGRPVGSYGDVPVRHNPSAVAPELPPQQPVNVNRGQVSSAFEKSESLEDLHEERRDALKTKLLDKTWVGATLGASNMKESNSGSTVGVGLNIGTNIDDTFGVELGWGYAKQNLRMGLASRGANVDANAGLTGMAPDSDASLSSHLFTGEVQAHLTDPVKRLRPYIGGGLGWRTATLSENRTPVTGQDLGYSTSLGGGSLRQSTFGALAVAGTKLRVSKAWNLGFAFRYFIPVARQDARLEQASASYPGQASSDSKLSQADEILTGSSQYQVLGGVQYAF